MWSQIRIKLHKSGHEDKGTKNHSKKKSNTSKQKLKTVEALLNQPCLPFLVWPSFLQLLSQRWASYLPVHLCLAGVISKWLQGHIKEKKVQGKHKPK
jgi:hypothetical protein